MGGCKGVGKYGPTFHLLAVSIPGSIVKAEGFEPSISCSQGRRITAVLRSDDTDAKDSNHAPPAIEVWCSTTGAIVSQNNLHRYYRKSKQKKRASSLLCVTLTRELAERWRRAFPRIDSYSCRALVVEYTQIFSGIKVIYDLDLSKTDLYSLHIADTSWSFSHHFFANLAEIFDLLILAGEQPLIA